MKIRNYVFSSVSNVSNLFQLHNILIMTVMSILFEPIVSIPYLTILASLMLYFANGW
jgi:hypothetical protein